MGRLVTSLYAVFLILLSVALFSCSTNSINQKEAAEEYNRAQLQTGPYTIGVDDQVSISVWGNPDLSLDMPVRPDGKISMPLIGDVQAGGLTPEQVAADIKSKLTRYIKNPNVTVILTELRSTSYISRIRVTGAVRTPISIPYRQGMTLLDAVLAAGGLTEFAAPGRTKLYRQVNKNTKIIDIDLEAILNDGDLTTNLKLIPGDIVAVPERFL
jgi:polysaccharide export outer membrane protein